ncbi:MAG: hypothetical protein NZ108_10245, partial [Bacteroidia bacterium]|nr:hypothetical protein [Bacteroidia bacterium]
SDLTTTFNAWSFNTETFEDAFRSTGNEIPQNSIELTLPAARLGVGYRFWAEKKFNLLTSFDSEVYFDGKRNAIGSVGRVTFDPRIGLEASYKGIVFLRAGAMNFQTVPDMDGNKKLDVYPTAGIGIAIKNIQLDYALSNIGDFKNNLYSHLFSLKFTWVKPNKTIY